MYTCIRITYHGRRGRGHVYMYTDYIPCQEKEAVMYTCIRITYHGRRGSGHVYMYTDYIPCQEKEAVMYTCIRIIGTDFVSVSTLFWLNLRTVLKVWHVVNRFTLIPVKKVFITFWHILHEENMFCFCFCFFVVFSCVFLYCLHLLFFALFCLFFSA